MSCAGRRHEDCSWQKDARRRVLATGIAARTRAGAKQHKRRVVFMPFTAQSSSAGHRPAPTPWRRASALTLTVLFLSGLLEGGVINTKHDLSDASGGPDNTQVCAFCHTPHSANRILNAPLWNRFVDRTKVFIPYQSSTMNTVPGDPNNSLGSLLCLGCHDGTLGTAVVNLYAGSDKHDLVNAPGPG